MASRELLTYHPRSHDDLQDLVLATVPREGGKVLDAAAGDGNISRKMSALGFDVTSADIHFDGDFAMTRTVVADFNERLPFADGAFDGAVSVETIEHLENPWLFVRELGRVTRRGGFVIISTPNTGNIHSRVLMLAEARPAWFRPHHLAPLGHITPIFGHLLEEMTRRAGLARESVRYTGARIPATMRRVPVRNALVGECLVARYRRVDA